MEVFRCVLVLGTVATADMAAMQAHAQMNPCIAHLQALSTARCVGADVANRIKMRALLSHFYAPKTG